MATATLIEAGIGMVAGLVASGVMEGYQALAAKPFGQDKSSEDPATVKAADTAAEATTGRPVPKPQRETVGRGVHYATGAVLGLLYGVLAVQWPPVTIGFGLAFGFAVWLWLDLVVVPGAGWGKPVWKSTAAALAYGLSAHLVFGAALEGSRRLLDLAD